MTNGTLEPSQVEDDVFPVYLEPPTDEWTALVPPRHLQDDVGGAAALSAPPLRRRHPNFAAGNQGNAFAPADGDNGWG